MELEVNQQEEIEKEIKKIFNIFKEAVKFLAAFFIRKVLVFLIQFKIFY
jgi:hypothetical protein